MYKDKQKRAEMSKLRMQKYRKLHPKKTLHPVTPYVTPVTFSVTFDSTQLPDNPIMLKQQARDRALHYRD